MFNIWGDEVYCNKMPFCTLTNCTINVHFVQLSTLNDL